MWFVSGERYMALQQRYEEAQRQFAEAQRLVIAYERQCETLIDNFNKLVTELIAMKREGFAPGAPPLEFPQREEIPAEIEEALQSRARGDHALYARMFRDAVIKLQTKPLEEVKKGILNGSRINPFDL